MGLSPVLDEVLDPQPHRRIDPLPVELGAGHPAQPLALGVLLQRPAQQPALESERELLADLTVGLDDHSLGIGVDADESGDLPVEPGLLAYLPHHRVGDALPELMGAARQGVKSLVLPTS